MTPVRRRATRAVHLKFGGALRAQGAGRRVGRQAQDRQRQARQADSRKIFDQQGTGRFGARKESWIGKQFDPEQRQAMIDKQFSKEQDDPSDEPKVDSTGLDSTGLSGLSGGSYTAY